MFMGKLVRPAQCQADILHGSFGALVLYGTLRADSMMARKANPSTSVAGYTTATDPLCPGQRDPSGMRYFDVRGFVN